MPGESAAAAGLVSGPRADGLAAELLRCHVCDCLGQLPTVAGEIHKGAVPLAVLSVDRRFEHTRAMISSVCESVVDVGHPDPNNLCSPARFRRVPVTADVRDDHGPVLPDGQLGPMTLANPRPLDEAEGGGQEAHGSAGRLGTRAPALPWAAGPTD